MTSSNATSPTAYRPPSPAAPASDIASWNAITPVKPATSAAYPAITIGSDDPSAFAKAFVTELFRRDYRTATRAELVSWAQYENAPLPSPNYPRADWSKVLVDSLTDLTWDGASATPIPADGLWLALRSEQARDSVSGVTVTPDPTWEAKIASGWKPIDPLATTLDVSLTIVRHTVSNGTPQTSTYAVSIIVQLGSSPRGDYGVAATNNYVSREVR